MPVIYALPRCDFPQKGQKDTIVSAIEWIMDRYQVTIGKDSGIRNDPNDWAEERGEPRYILDLLLRIITVSIRTVDIVDGLPGLVFRA